MELEWKDGFVIKVSIHNGAVLLSANKAGLESLANHLSALAHDEVPGTHIHLDEHNSLEDHSAELVIERLDR